MARKKKEEAPIELPKKGKGTKKSKKQENEDLPEWEVTKSGAYKHKDGVWYAGAYLSGWFFYTGSFTNNMGPYNTMEEGFAAWKKAHAS